MPSIENKVPLLNEYKEEFLWKRVPQSLLGGPKLRIGYDSPIYVYINQILIFIVPWVIGGIFTLLVQLNVLNFDIGIYIVGALVFIYSLCLQTVALIIRKRKSSIVPAAVNNTKTMLAEEDEILFESCCGIETVDFIVPPKRYKINIVIHSLLAGGTCGLAFWYLLPVTLNTLYNNIGATIIIYIIGWITVCIGIYSLTVSPPPEPAAFRTVDNYEIAPLTRPFYILLFCCFDLLARYLTSGHDGLVLLNQILHVVFIFLPIVWLFGILPPIDALFLWFSEQLLVFIYGGSPMASDLRLMLMLLASVCLSIAVYFIPTGISTVIIISGFGYLYSIDLSGLATQILNLCVKDKARHDDQSYIIVPNGFLWKWDFREALFHIFMLAVSVGVASGIFYAKSLPDNTTFFGDISKYIGYCIIALLVFEVLLAEIQSVYVGLGLWRNILYPKSADRNAVFLKRKKFLKIFGFIRRVLINFVSPVIILAYVSINTSFSTAINDNFELYLTLAGYVRAFRWVWQNTQHSLLEISVLHILTIALPATNIFTSFNMSVKLTIISLSRDRISQLINKLYFLLTLMVKSWSDKKQRHKFTIPLLVINLALFPFLLLMLCGSVIFSAPLLPLFTMPLFIIGFPRPLRFWSSPVGASANVGDDTAFYKQLAPQLANAIHVASANGSIGEPHPGKYYLVRFQDRLAWVTILELGYRYCTVSIKGLELQETSCHTVEATRLDDQIQLAFECTNGVSCCTWNKYPAGVLTPCDAAVVKTYSDAKNVLTGVIDSPDTLQNIIKGFPKTFIWVILKYLSKQKETLKPIKRPLSAQSTGQSKVFSVQPLGVKEDPTIMKQNPGFKDTWESGIFENGSHQVKPGLNKEDDSTVRRSPSLKSFNSLWSDDNESLLLEPVGKNKPQNVNLIAGLNRSKHTESVGIGSAGSSKSETKTHTTHIPGTPLGVRDDIDNLLEDLDMGLPAIDVSHQVKPVGGKLYNKSNTTSHNTLPPLAKVGKGNANLTTIPQFSCKHSEKLTVPVAWRDTAVDSSMITSLTKLFDNEWFKHVLSSLDLEAEEQDMSKVVTEMSQDPVLSKMYSDLVLSCYAIVNIIGVGSNDTSLLGTSHVYKAYTGEIPWSPSLDWLTENPQLFDLTLKAYRYAVKLAIDQMLLGEVSSHEELQEYLEEYDKDWYIGSEKEETWKHAVSAAKPQLFSLTYDPSSGVYSSRTLSNQDMTVYISSVNQEAVRGQWANLALELLYMTNDDEERYSIQAHATLMRNISVQAADPPLGYPVFASQPISVPIL